MGKGLLMGNDIYPLRKTHQTVDMVAVTVGENDIADGMRSQLLDFRNHLFGRIFGHLGVDGQDFLFTDEKAVVGAHPAFELIDVSLDILNGDGRDFLLQRLCLLRSLLLSRTRGNKTQEKKTENDIGKRALHGEFLPLFYFSFRYSGPFFHSSILLPRVSAVN